MQNDYVDKVLGKKALLPSALMDKATAALGGQDTNDDPDYRTTHIEHHKDRSHTVRQSPRNGGEEVSYSAKDDNELMQKLKKNLGKKEKPSKKEKEASEPKVEGDPQA